MSDATDELERLKAENLRLRKILANVSAKIAIRAKENAGYGEHVRPAAHRPKNKPD